MQRCARIGLLCIACMASAAILPERTRHDVCMRGMLLVLNDILLLSPAPDASCIPHPNFTVPIPIAPAAEPEDGVAHTGDP